MGDWNLPTIIVAVIVFGITAAIIIRGVMNRRSGKSSCGCGCEGCASKGICHQVNAEVEAALKADTKAK